MGDTLHIVVNDTRGYPGAGDDLSILLRMEKQVDRLCEQLGVVKLSECVDSSEMAADAIEWMRQDAEEGRISEADIPLPDPAMFEPRWFEAAPALAAVRAVVSQLEQHPADLRFHPDPSRAHWPGQLLDELRICEAALAEAVARGKQFHFQLLS